MKTTAFPNLPANVEQVKVFDIKLVEGDCIIPFDIYFVTVSADNTYVRAVAFPGNEREYPVLIDKADIVSNLATGETSGSIWIDLDTGEPTGMSMSLGAAIEKKCRERQA
jgi:hypothetical protein